MTCNIHFIDLGLPSGTLWADRNIGADSPEAFGDYFRFGETVPFTLDSPKYKSENFGKDIANTIYDSAMICLGVNFKIPSQYQANELMDFCQWERKILGGNYVISHNGLDFSPLNGGRPVVVADTISVSGEDNMNLWDVRCL